MLTNFNNSFTAAFSDELQKMLEENLPPHLKSSQHLREKWWKYGAVADVFYGTVYFRIAHLTAEKNSHKSYSTTYKK